MAPDPNPTIKPGPKAEPSNASSPSEDPSQTEETTLVSALSLLHQMHQKLALLRESIPHMVQPIMKASAYPTPETLFDEFSKRTLKASEDLVDFTKLVSDGRWVFDKASTSRRENGDEGGEVKRWKSSAPLPHYLKDIAEGSEAVGKDKEAKKKEEEEKKEKKRLEAERSKERELEIAEVKEFESEDVRRGIIEEFKKEHGDLEITAEEDGKVLKVAIPKPVGLTFSIDIPQPTAESNRYTVSLPTSSYLHILVLRSITTRPNAGSLKYLLDMVATYKTIYKTKCNKCNKLTQGPKADLPVIRRLKRIAKLVQKESKEDGGSSQDNDKMDTSGDNKVVKDAKDANPKIKKEPEEEEQPKEENDGTDDVAEVELVEEFWVTYHEGCAA
ncbi:hypothetical protein TWF225_008142 [Orbilia oligospora]|uniref:Uncharacterized protein n=1 Tax=Orbilia oligospora TaxID=2813651 RepID=A0A8H2HSP8_ORBOL|nr:hypothetical protein TWF225_008142 [Orbilia oligospora]KAF3261362.1 hypothetical protein TWF128_003133 [Orbilia oligospora]KAF3268849.1 hypothetical protein TWF217_010145 [Orbilia oligospora]KAF3293272.1 hypothetical protein TWF132_004914 [Orbilia oligospora]TGJ67802.1 hypothetical protein EYR41_006905 [Orbilia oligospora]